jgi:hypothetical protein
MAIHKKSTSGRLSRKNWQDIEFALTHKTKTIQNIADFYGISRTSIYAHAWRHNIIQKKEKSLWQRFLEFLMIWRFK